MIYRPSEHSGADGCAHCGGELNTGMVCNYCGSVPRPVPDRFHPQQCEIELAAARAELAALREENKQHKETWARALSGGGLSEEENRVFDAIFGPTPDAKLAAALQAENARMRAALEQAGKELGVPQPGYPAPVANAAEIIASALSTPAPADQQMADLMEEAERQHDASPAPAGAKDPMPTVQDFIDGSKVIARVLRGEDSEVFVPRGRIRALERIVALACASEHGMMVSRMKAAQLLGCSMLDLDERLAAAIRDAEDSMRSRAET